MESLRAAAHRSAAPIPSPRGQIFTTDLFARTAVCSNPSPFLVCPFGPGRERMGAMLRKVLLAAVTCLALTVAVVADDKKPPDPNAYGEAMMKAAAVGE